MPSRGDTLRWLGDDDLTSLSNKVADILKLDVGAGAESPSVGETRSPETEAAFSDSFFPRSGGQVVPDARSPTPDVSAVADAVDTVTLVTPVSAGVRGEKDVAAADVATESPHVAGAAGGRSTDTLLGTLAQFADETESLELFAVEPLQFCPHLAEVQPLPSSGLSSREPCQVCGAVGENWICLTCYETQCSRYVHGHMKQHGVETGHSVVLSFADISAWCYACDAYVHHAILLPAKQAAYLDKFGDEMPVLHNSL